MGTLGQLDWGFSLDFLPVACLCLLSSDVNMNVQACSRCGYGVYPAEKISCLDQVSRHFLAFGNNNKLGKLIFSYVDVWVFGTTKKKGVFPTFLLLEPCVCVFTIILFPKTQFFTLKHGRILSLRKGNFAKSFLCDF